MPVNQFLQVLRDGKVLIGLSCGYTDPTIIESICKGFNFVWIDAQHGIVNESSTLGAIRAATGIGVQSMVRTPGQNPDVLLRFADQVPSALMVPMVNTAAEARAVVEALRFPPKGRRSYGARRAGDLYGRKYYVETELAVVVQIETAEALSNLEAIAATDGIDLLFLGPDDMKLSMGLPEDTPMTHDALDAAFRAVAEAARAAGKYAGCIAPTEKGARAAVEAGYQLVVGGGDTLFLRNGAAAALGMMRGVVGQKGT